MIEPLNEILDRLGNLRDHYWLLVARDVPVARLFRDGAICGVTTLPDDKDPGTELCLMASTDSDNLVLDVWDRDSDDPVFHLEAPRFSCEQVDEALAVWRSL